MSYVHLHCHNSFSLLDGISLRKDLILKAKEYGQTALAETNHGNLFNGISFYADCVKAGIKPVLGCEMYIAPDSRHNRDYKKAKDIEDGDISEFAYHLILLAKNAEGYQNLKALSTLSWREGFYKKPRIDFEILAAHSKGLIATSGCIGSIISQAIIQGAPDKAVEYINKFRYIFGEDFFLELMSHDMPEDVMVSKALLDFGQKLGIPAIITNDSHFTNRSDDTAHEVALCMLTKKTMSDPTHWKFPGQGYWFKSSEEMLQTVRKAGYPEEVFHNTGTIAGKIEDYGFKLGKHMVPKFRDQNKKQWESDESHDKLVMAAWDGLAKRGMADKPEYTERLEFELDMMKRKNFSSYFLIIADVIRFIDEELHDMRPFGRGSSVGSLVCYALGITAMDPVRWNIPFYRFINEGRKDLPDVDTDISQRNRSEVIKYIQRTYGEDRVAQIATFTMLAAKSAIDSVGRALDVPAAVRRSVSKLIGETEKDDIVEELLDNNKEAHSLMAAHPGWIETAQRLQGVHRNKGVHAAGIVISNEPVDIYTPLAGDNNGFRATQYDMVDCAQLGLLKLDMLGLRTIDTIHDTVKLVKARHDISLDVYNLPVDDAAVYKLLCDAEFVSVFQYDSQGMRALSKKLRPDNFELLMALNALYRPGPMEPQKIVGSDGKEHHAPSICDIYLERRHGREKVEAWHPSLDGIMATTQGMPLYQEQISAMAMEIAGFTDTEADEYRAAIGKKNKIKFDAAQAKFKHHGMGKGHSEEFMTSLVDRLAGFARYGWCKGHANGYSMLSYVTAYLEAHYPIEYYTALLNTNLDDNDQLNVLLAGIMQKGIEIKPPNVNHSGAYFTTDGTYIYMGLYSVKQLGAPGAAAIAWDREVNGVYAGYMNFIYRICNLKPLPTDHPIFKEFILPDWDYVKIPTVPGLFTFKAVNKTIIDNLVKAGAFSFDTALTDKDKLLCTEAAQKISKKKNVDPTTIEFKVIGDMSESLTSTEFTKLERATLERDVLQFYVSGHPVTAYMRFIGILQGEGCIITPSGVKNEDVRNSIVIIGMLAKKELKTTKNNNPYLSLKIQDQFGDIVVRIWAPLATEVWPTLQENGIVLLRGVTVADNFREGMVDIKVNSIRSVGVGLPIRGWVCDTEAQIGPLSDMLGMVPDSKVNVIGVGWICQLAQPTIIPMEALEKVLTWSGHASVKLLLSV